MHDYTDIAVSSPRTHVQLIRLNRPEVLNALRQRLLAEIKSALARAAEDDEVRALVITGDQRAFAAGADINELNAHDRVSILSDSRLANWQAIRTFAKPVIAAVNGFCLGGGCELAMSADIIIAGEDARFGQPEINLGLIPGAGGTQRLPRIVGRSLAMRMVLTGEPIDARAALAAGLVAEVVQPELVVERALDIAATIAQKSPIAVRMAKAAVLQADETGLAAGLDYERRTFQILFATEDKAEGTAAFLGKRKPTFKGR